MSWNHTHPAFKQAIGVHEGFRRLGFEAKDIYVHLNPDQTMLIVLKTQGKEFGITVGVVDMPRERWIQEWTAVTAGVMDGSIPDDALQEWFDNSLAKTRAFDFVMALLEKGIRIPKTSQRLN